jgi:hypothetical protein
MVLGYSISGPDNDYTMYRKFPLDECSKYKDVYSINRINPALKFKNIPHALSYTYDGFCIVSAKLKAFCEAEKYAGMEFVDVSDGCHFFWLKLHAIIEFDAAAKGTQFINYNMACDGYEEIIGATPVRLKEEKPLADGFYRTDLCFGSYAGKSPIYLVGDETKTKLEAAGFDDIYFRLIKEK